MRVNKETYYALRIMVYMVKIGHGVKVIRNDLSEKECIPRHFLAKIAQNLAKAGYIEIRQGPMGGYFLSCDPGEVSFLDIVEVMIGPIDIGSAMDTGEVKDVFDTLNAEIRERLGKIFLSNFL